MKQLGKLPIDPFNNFWIVKYEVNKVIYLRHASSKYTIDEVYKLTKTIKHAEIIGIYRSICCL